MKTIRLKSPAKVNLRLDILGKRPDGYHDLHMLNSAVSLFDEIEINVVEKGINVECFNDALVPSGEANIAFKATKEIMAYSNKNVGIAITINKNIPSGAGMGGGSSNAASVILGLNQMLHINLSREKLIRIGMRFGADIPFFLYGGPAIATGIGENLTKVKKLPKMPFVILSPHLNVSTKAIYEKYQPNGNGTNGREEFPREFPTKKAVVKFLHNDLEKVTARQYPIVNFLKELLIKHGALGAQMTGSGPSVFGIFSDKEKAGKALKKIMAREGDHLKAFLAENI